jgi:hypothetical protein
LDQSAILILLGIVLALAFAEAVFQRRFQGRRVVPLLIVLMAVAAVGGYFVYKHHEESREARERAARRAEYARRITQFIAKNNAVTDWQKPLFAKGTPEKIYTVELARLLVRADGRPILVFASLLNVGESDERTVIYFDEVDRPESQFKLQLDCTPEQARLLTSDNSAYRFAVIAQVRSVEYVLAGDYSLATGRCVDVMGVSMGDYLEFVVEPELEKHTHYAGG